MGTYRNLPVPQPGPDHLPFWTGAQQGRLVIQRCSNCERYRYPPVPTCKHCLSLESSWEPVSGRGTIWSWVVFHRPYFENVEVPYTVAIVELAEGPLIATNLVDTQPDSPPTIGGPVEVVFRPIGDGRAIPLFKVLGTPG